MSQIRYDLRSYGKFLMEQIELQSPLIYLFNDIENVILVAQFCDGGLDEKGNYQSVILRVAKSPKDFSDPETYQEFQLTDLWRHYTLGTSEKCDLRIDPDSPLYRDTPYIRQGLYPVHVVLGFSSRDKFVMQPAGVFSLIGVSYKTLPQILNSQNSLQFQIKHNQKLRIGGYLFQVQIVEGIENRLTEEEQKKTELIAQKIGVFGETDMTSLRSSFLALQSKLSQEENVEQDFEKLIQLWETGKIPFILPHMLTRKDKLIGQGSFGVVYEGSYLNFDVAIKQIEIQYSQFSDSVIKEILFLAELSGWNSFLTLYGIYFQIKAESLYVLIVTELCQANLSTLLQNEKLFQSLSVRTKLILLFNISFGIYVMQLGITRIVHRDLKPDNVLLRTLDFSSFSSETDLQNISFAKISDFGLSMRIPEKFEDGK